MNRLQGVSSMAGSRIMMRPQGSMMMAQPRKNISNQEVGVI